jgi:hypothetical protein
MHFQSSLIWELLIIKYIGIPPDNFTSNINNYKLNVRTTVVLFELGKYLSLKRCL